MGNNSLEISWWSLLLYFCHPNLRISKGKKMWNQAILLSK